MSTEDVHRRPAGQTSGTDQPLSDQVESVSAMWKTMQAVQEVYKKQAGDKKMLAGAAIFLTIVTLFVVGLIAGEEAGASGKAGTYKQRVESDDIIWLKSLTVNPQAKRADWVEYARVVGGNMINSTDLIGTLFLGDHFEAWGGTQLGESCPVRSHCANTSLMIQQQFYSELPGLYTSASISGDTTQNLLWRVTIDKSFDKVSPDLCVLHMGTEDLTYGMRPEQVAAGVRAVLKALQRRMMDTQFLIVGVLPRADDVFNAHQKGSHSSGLFSFNTPKPLKGSVSFTSSKYYEPVSQLNAYLRSVADEMGSHWLVKPPVYFLDCTHQFLVPHSGSTWHSEQGAAATEIPLNLMPDMLHLSAQGQERLASCLQDTVRQLTWIAKSVKIDKQNRMAKLGRRLSTSTV